MDAPWEVTADQPADGEQSWTEFDDASEQYVGRWNRLVSQTNWEKGRIIFEWRSALEETGAPASAYSDEVWSRRVGGVTPQHVGRLRRVYQRFGEVQSEFAGLYWSHFQVALDWEDAEMWLEGGVQNGWSVAQMRSKRAETLGLTEEVMSPVASAVEMDEDFAEPVPAAGREASAAKRATESETDSEASTRTPGDASERGDSTAHDSDQTLDESSRSPVKPFAELPELPDDLQEAFEAFKLAILRHKTADWQDVSPANVVSALSALEALVTAP